MTNRKVLGCSAVALALFGSAPAQAQGLVSGKRISAALAGEAVAAAVQACAEKKYTVSAVMVDFSGVQQAALRGDGTGPENLAIANDKAYTAVSFQADTAELVARAYNLSRSQLDEFSASSQAKAVAAQAEGRFAREIVPYPVPQPDGSVLAFAMDEHPRPGTTVQTLSSLKPAFREDGVIHAGNASGIVDGAAAVAFRGVSLRHSIRMFEVPRFFINRSDSHESFQQKVAGHYDWLGAIQESTPHWLKAMVSPEDKY